ncbi:ORF6N domain-containing protein [Patescibacteria group bacterium]|nr:ORF6N domain-containing protein [Patescibacteria group bacterium]
MLDCDLAELYGIETRILNQAVKRNLERFPEDFMFQLNAEEANFLRSQFVTLNPTALTSQIVISKGRGKHRKYLPYIFTEQGVAMLSSVLRSPQAIKVNIEIMRAFVRFRHTLESNKELAKIVSELRSFVLKKSGKTDQEIHRIWKAIEKMAKPIDDDRRIGFRLE